MISVAFECKELVDECLAMCRCGWGGVCNLLLFWQFYNWGRLYDYRAGTRPAPYRCALASWRGDARRTSPPRPAPTTSGEDLQTAHATPPLEGARICAPRLLPMILYANE